VKLASAMQLGVNWYLSSAMQLLPNQVATSIDWKQVGGGGLVSK